MKFISWNVNGLRAVLKKDFMTTFNQLDADFFCLQETKMQAGQVELDLPGYHQYFNYAEKKAIPVLPSSLSINHSLQLMVSANLNTITKDA